MDSLSVAESTILGNATLPLLGHSNVWVDASDPDASVCLVQALVQKALEGTAPGQLEVIVYDEALSGLAAPFKPLGDGTDKVLRVLNDEQDLKGALAYLRDDIQSVKKVMRGEAPTLAEYRKQLGYPVEGYKLMVVSADFSLLNEDIRTQLGVLFTAGPAAGVSFIVHSIADGVNEYLLKTFEQLSPWGGKIEWVGHGDITGWAPSTARELVASSDRIAHAMATTGMEPISFAEVQSTNQMWNQSSMNGLTFAIGRYGRDVVELTLGDEVNQRHNMLITGAVGQGKSNLISVIIHSLCQRYSPSELELYLLDFKEGVTLQQFFNPATGEFLPQARVLGLEADREFGLSVFRHLFDVYKARMRQFKAANVQGIREYRRDHPQEVMPRIVVIIDEFQMMFTEHDRVSDEIADLLVRGVRLFRASGIHVILASQTIGGNMALMGSAGEGLFGQVPIRIALKNSLVESHATLSIKNDAATYLRVGQAIVNQDYGEVASNEKTTIALADRDTMAGLRHRWWEAARGRVTPPDVFEGEKRRSLVDDAGCLRSLRNCATPQLLLGSRIEVGSQTLSLGFGSDIGRNAVVLGSGDTVQQIESMVVSLAVQKPHQIVVLDVLAGNEVWNQTKDSFMTMVREAGSPVEIVSKEHIPDAITSVASTLATRETTDVPLVLVGLGMDRARTLPIDFQDLLKDGPAVGVHVIGWWSKMASLRQHAGYDWESMFDIRMALKLDGESAKQLMQDPLLQWTPIDNRMLAWDVADLPEAITVIPYSTLRPDTVRIIRGAQ